MTNVISLAKERLKRGHSAIRDVDEYWCTLAGGAVPSREAVKPRALGPILSHVALLERVAPGHARIRVAGSLFSDAMGMDVKGMPFSVLFDPEARPELRSILSAVMDQPARAQLSLRADYAIGRPALSGQMLILPLAGTSDEPDALICALSLEPGPLGRTPRRFSIPDSFVRRIDDAASAIRP